MGLCSGSPGPGGGRPQSSLPPPRTHGRGQSVPLAALETEGAALALALSPLPARGASSQPITHLLFGVGSRIRASPVLLPPDNRHVRPSLLCHSPSFSPWGTWGSLQALQDLPHFSAFLGHRGPLDAPQASSAQDSGPSCEAVRLE